MALKPCADTVRFFVELAPAEDLDRHALARREAAARSASGVTSAPSSKRLEVGRLTGWVWVRNGSNGIDFFMCGPRSLRIRMWIGFWPPS